MKIITYYLPQFHQIPENDEWWGEGFTEWVNVKKAKPLFEGHDQPVIPLNKNYYDLSVLDTLKWQVKLAKQYHIWGFCFYHYWFGSKLLLQKPMEMLLKHQEIDINYCVSWANENWTNQWISNDPKILIKQEYGDQVEWKRHFEYLLQFFNDSRYIKHENKPVVVIYKPANFPSINDMIDKWNEWAIESGFDGICFMSQISYLYNEQPESYRKMSYLLDYQPTDVLIKIGRTRYTFIRKIKNLIKILARHMEFELEGKKIGGLRRYEYNDIWAKILEKPPYDSRNVPGCFKNWDNTPRKGNQGIVMQGASPESFKIFLEVQIKKCKSLYNKDFMFMFAWNEWAEGGYLEPDEKDGYKYLEVIRDLLIELKEVPLDFYQAIL